MQSCFRDGFLALALVSCFLFPPLAAWAITTPTDITALTKGCVDRTRPEALVKCKKLCKDGYQFYCDAIKGEVVEDTPPPPDTTGSCDMSGPAPGYFGQTNPPAHWQTLVKSCRYPLDDPGRYKRAEESRRINADYIATHPDATLFSAGTLGEEYCYPLCEAGCKEYCDLCGLGYKAYCKGNKKPGVGLPGVKPGFIPMYSTDSKVHDSHRWPGFCCEWNHVNFTALYNAFKAGVLGSKDEWDGIPTPFEQYWLSVYRSRSDRFFFTYWWQPRNNEQNPWVVNAGNKKNYEMYGVLTPGLHSYRHPTWGWPTWIDYRP